MQQVSRSFLAASLARCRWLPCPPSSGGDDGSGDGEWVDTPCVLASWSEEAKQHIVTVGDARRAVETGEMLQFVPRLTLRHPGAVTDLQVARVDDSIVAATGGADGGVGLLLMQLPPVPGAGTADLQFVAAAAGGGGGGQGGADSDDDDAADAAEYLQELPDLHEGGPVASVDVSAARRALLSVAGDGGICVVPLDALAQAGGDDCCFKPPGGGWGGFSCGRWVDRQCFATAGALGGLQLWDVRRGPKAVASSPLEWGHTGCAALDRQHGAARRVLALDVHPSRPNLAATGGSCGAVALWDLRFASRPLTAGSSSSSGSGGGVGAASGDVWEVRFDPCAEPLSSAAAGGAVPPLLFCTSDGALCSATGGSGGGGGVSSGGLAVELLLREPASINSFDVEAALGQDVVAVTDAECMLLLSRAVE